MIPLGIVVVGTVGLGSPAISTGLGARFDVSVFLRKCNNGNRYAKVLPLPVSELSSTSCLSCSFCPSVDDDGFLFSGFKALPKKCCKIKACIGEG